MTRQNMVNLLLHICCAPDGLFVSKLLGDEYHVTGFFYNPNIYPVGEYSLRLEETRKAARLSGVDLVEGEYEPTHWDELARPFAADPEKGRRCSLCYAIRMKKTALKARELGFPVFGTVMSLSPWKNAEAMNRIGRMFANRYGLIFLEADFKKKDGFKKSVDLSRELDLYRQSYCGCKYSMR